MTINFYKRRNMTPVVTYLRTSSNQNVGVDKDSDKRQRSKIDDYVKKNGYSIHKEFYDSGVKGTLDILNRPRFMEMITYCEKQNIKTIVFENSTRLSRDLICQETGFQYLSGLGFSLISVESPDSFVNESPTSVLVRQILGCISQFDKSTIVEKLKSSRDRKKIVNREKGIVDRNGSGKSGGRLRISEKNPDVIDFVVKSRKKDLSYRKISELVESEMDVKISHVGVKNLLDEIEPLRKFERNRKRRKNSLYSSINYHIISSSSQF